MQERLYNIFYGNGEGRMENKLEEKSYRKNVIKIIIGCILLAIAGIEITVKVLVWKRNWMTNFLDALILLVTKTSHTLNGIRTLKIQQYRQLNSKLSHGS